MSDPEEFAENLPAVQETFREWDRTVLFNMALLEGISAIDYFVMPDHRLETSVIPAAAGVALFGLYKSMNHFTLKYFRDRASNASPQSEV